LLALAAITAATEFKVLFAGPEEIALDEDRKRKLKGLGYLK